MRAVWLNGALVAPTAASVGIDCVAVRFGEGLFETMYGVGNDVPRLAGHLARICASAATLGLAIAPREELHAAVLSAVGACGARHQRVRLSAAPDLVLVEASEIAPPGRTPHVSRAAVIADSWFPGRQIAEHKTLSYGGYRLARRRAEAADAEVALLADASGRLGEADNGNLFAVVGGEMITPPVDGLLPGLARNALLQADCAREGDLTPTVLRAATELFMTNGVGGVTVLIDVAGAPWSCDTPGPGALRAHRTLFENL